MTSVLKADKLEELLVANWTNFIDAAKLMAFVLACVRNNMRSNFSVVEQKVGGRKGVQVTISRFQLAADGFILWVDFNVPSEDNVAVGTSELHLSPAGTLSHLRTLGSLFCQG